MAKSDVKVVKVTDKKIAKLIDEGARLKKQVDKDEYRLKEIKTELGEVYGLETAKHTTPKGSALTISEKTTYSEINPVECRKVLTERRLGPKFPYVVKVVIGELRKVLSEEDIATMHTKTGTTRSFAFTG